MDQIRCDCSSSEKIIKKLSLVGADVAHCASPIWKFPSFISFSTINDTVKLVNSCWLCSTSSPPTAGHVPFSGCFSRVLGNLRVALIWRFHVAQAGISHSFSGLIIHAPSFMESLLCSLPGLWSLDSLVIQFMALPQTYHWEFGHVSSWPEPVSLFRKTRLGPTLPGFAWVSFASSIMSTVETNKHCSVHLDGHSTFHFQV